MAEQRERAKADARAKKGQHADTAAYRARRSTRSARPSGYAYETLETESTARRRCCAAARRSTAAREGDDRSSWSSTAPRSTPSAAASSPTPGIDRARRRRALEVLDVQRPITGLVVHQVRVARAASSTAGARGARAGRPRAAHSARARRTPATHMVHAALREVLGPTALQSGS